jgi:GH18 family chitinase
MVNRQLTVTAPQDKDVKTVITSLKEKNSNIKILASIWASYLGDDLHRLTADSALRKRFITSAITMAQANGFDGINLVSLFNAVCFNYLTPLFF